MLPFVADVAAKFIAPSVRNSLIWFGSTGNLELPLTSDPEELAAALTSMANAPDPLVPQGTNIGSGLDEILNQVVDSPESEVSRIAFVVSDGNTFLDICLWYDI